MFTAPFDSDTLGKIISGEIKNPEIDYTNSKIKGKNLITYISNLKYNVTLHLGEITKDEKFILLNEYIKHPSTVKIQQFENTILKSLFSLKGFDLGLVDASEFDREALSDCILSNDEILEYVVHNRELIMQLASVLDGVLLYCIKNLSAYKEEFGETITSNVVVDKIEIGKTFVNFFSNEVFNYHYYTVLPDFSNMVYYDYYYDKPIYSGQILLSFITNECVIFPILSMILNQEFTPEQLKGIQEHAASI
jgi:hypothetical protein